MNFNTVKTRLAERLDDTLGAKQVARLQQAREVDKARQLIEHPGWEMYMAWLDEQIARLSRMQETLTQTMLTAPSTDAMLQARLGVVEVASQARAYRLAKETIPSLLQQADVTKEIV